jgi:UDP-3-O-[3-hydroxymyristoyl] glucosamine N-acyltransferase LpxD
MIHEGRLLTPEIKERARYYNYTWWNGEDPYPIPAGYVFPSKHDMAEQIYRDFPDGKPLEIAGKPDWVGEGTVIGGPGFGWYGNPPKRFPHIGGIVFGLGVEIGANTTIDRGAIASTVIRDNVKIDNGVHVGHNVHIGESSILTAHCCIGGSVRIGERCWIGLGAQIKNQIEIGDGATVGMGAVVVKDVPSGVTVVGNPARILK